MRKNESGQALVLILLSLAVVLTIVLFILSRSITDVSVSSGQADSVRAFSAAEAGIEQTLVVGSASGNSIAIGGATYTAGVTDLAQGSTDFPYPSPLISGDSMTTWFVSHDKTTGNMVCDGTSAHPCFTGNSMKICWGNASTSVGSSTTPAIEVSIYYEKTANDYSSVQISRVTADPYTSRISLNSFAGVDSVSSCTIGTTTYKFQKTITLTPRASSNTLVGPLFARVKILYNTDAAYPVGVSVAGSGSTFPSQGQDIVSTGTAGESNRKIEVFQGWPEFTFGGESLFAPSSLTK